MSEEIIVNFNDLLNITFNDGSLHIKHLESLFKILVKQLEIRAVNISVDDLNLFNSAAFDVNQAKVDPVLKVLPRIEDLKKSLCERDSNPMLDMLNLLNVTKRIEALEVSIYTLTSLMEAVLKMEARFDEKFEQMKVSPAFVPDVQETTEEQKVELETLSISSQTQTDQISINSPSFEAHQSECSMEQACEVTSLPKTPRISQIEAQAQSDFIIKQQMTEEHKESSEMVSKITQDICDIQKRIGDFQDKLDDLMFACELNDGRIEETSGELKNFNSKIFCLKTDVKTLMSESKGFKEKFVEVDEKYEAMNNVKTNKSYVDECLSLRAFNSDLIKFIKQGDFESIVDVIQLKFGLMDEQFEKLQMKMKKSFACLQSEMEGKLEKDELLKFKKTVATSFEEFLKELKLLLHPLMKTQVGVGGALKLMPDLNCILCESNISMKKSYPSIPKLETISVKFMNKLDRSCTIKSRKSTSNADFRKIFCSEEKSKDTSKSIVKNQETDQLNFPCSQPCFVITHDNSIVKADPLKCLKSSKYIKP